MHLSGKVRLFSRDMRLLLDQNISRKLLDVLEENFPDSNHVANLNLERALDSEIWEYARENDFIIVTQDSDFADRVVLFGYPPKVVWLRTGNVSRAYLEHTLRKEHELITAFGADDSKGCLVIR